MANSAGRTFGVSLLALAAGLAATGCAPALIGAGATVGIAAAQERTLGNAVDDTGIQIRIKDRLLENSTMLFAQVGVDVVEGRVLLTGTVNSPEDRVEALRIAWQVSSVTEVLNEIEVAERSGIVGYVTDVRITSQLRIRILLDAEVSDINYTVDTVRQTVYLLGVAQDQTELDRVIGHARTISGVQQVVNHVRLRDDPRRRP